MSSHSVKVYDLIIVGAGPAGSVLAYLLAKNGSRVLILEKAQLPRYKACGGGVTYKTVKNLPFDVTPVLDQQVCGGIVTYRGRPLSKTMLEKSYAWLVMRDEFDYFLASKAQQAGAELIDSAPVKAIHQQTGHVVVQTLKDKFYGLFVAGADGVNSKVASIAGVAMNEKLSVGVLTRVGNSCGAFAGGLVASGEGELSGMKNNQ